jgi:hypothetical protein
VYAWIGPDLVVDTDEVVAVLTAGDGGRSVVVTADGGRIPVPQGSETVVRRLVNNRLETNGAKSVG